MIQVGWGLTFLEESRKEHTAKVFALEPYVHGI